MLPGLEALSLSSGPAISEACGSGGQSTTGDFFVGKKTGWPETVQMALPWVIGGLVVWLALGRK